MTAPTRFITPPIEPPPTLSELLCLRRERRAEARADG